MDASLKHTGSTCHMFGGSERRHPYYVNPFQKNVTVMVFDGICVLVTSEERDVDFGDRLSSKLLYFL
jgi:hypothetical protein